MSDIPSLNLPEIAAVADFFAYILTIASFSNASAALFLKLNDFSEMKSLGENISLSHILKEIEGLIS